LQSVALKTNVFPLWNEYPQLKMDREVQKRTNVIVSTTSGTTSKRKGV
jgi:hypothetical protein